MRNSLFTGRRSNQSEASHFKPTKDQQRFHHPLFGTPITWLYFWACIRFKTRAKWRQANSTKNEQLQGDPQTKVKQAIPSQTKTSNEINTLYLLYLLLCFIFGLVFTSKQEQNGDKRIGEKKKNYKSTAAYSSINSNDALLSKVDGYNMFSTL